MSKPVDGQFTIALLRVIEIEPGKQRTFDDVKAEIAGAPCDRAGRPASSRRCTTRSRTSAAAGKPLKEIAEQLKLRSARCRDRSRRHGRATASRAIEHADSAARCVQAVFAAGAGIESRSRRAQRRRLCLGRRGRHHAREAEALRGGPGRGARRIGSTPRDARRSTAAAAKLVERLTRPARRRGCRQGRSAAEGRARPRPINAQHRAARAARKAACARSSPCQGRRSVGADGRRQIAHDLPRHRDHRRAGRPPPSRSTALRPSLPRQYAERRARRIRRRACRPATASPSTRRPCASARAAATRSGYRFRRLIAAAPRADNA